MLRVAAALAFTLLAGGGAGAGATRTLEDVLAFDALESETSCANVELTDAGGFPESPVVPPNPNGATPVGVFVFVLAISEIDAEANAFRFEGYGGLTWCDPRLAFDRSQHGADRRMVMGDAVRPALGGMWWPGAFLPTQIGVPDVSNELLVVHADGTVRYSAKFYSRLTADYDFSDFPLDRQTLRIPIQTGLWDSDRVVFRPIAAQSGFNPGFKIQEWTVLDWSARVDELNSSDGERGFARFALDIEVSRKIGFYLWKVCLPLLIILGVSWSVFWMTGDALGQRQRQVATAVLTLVAFQFVAVTVLPRVPYLTLMDAVMLWTFLVAASALVINTWACRRFRSDPESGLAADRLARGVYPLVYLVGLLVILGRRLILGI